MCGILGWINPALQDEAAAKAAIAPALRALRRRGPDGEGSAYNPGWVLGHTRLAILDLSDRARQPMSDGRGGWLVYNGEIYNYRELREELAAAGYRFRSSGDTEVLLYALRHWGPACLTRLRGMFAFGWLDAERRELLLARDRYGVKPLAYEFNGHDLRFASDLFALRALPSASRAVDPEAAYLYLGLGYVPAPHAILKNVRKVRPGHFMSVTWSAGGAFSFEEQAYWSIAEIPPAGESRDWDSEEAFAAYEEHAAEAVGYRLISDVPVGSLLSGGIDSTLVTALCREQPGADVPSYTMGFQDPAVDEAPFARALAERIGGRHTEFVPDEEEVLDVWSTLWTVYDEPFADSSALPMVALCRHVTRNVKVALSGDGGDEVFCGYPWHWALDRLRLVNSLPHPWRASLGQALGGMVPEFKYRADAFGQRDRMAQWSFLRTGLTLKELPYLPVEEAAGNAPFDQYFRAWGRDLEGVGQRLDWACRMDLITYLPDDLMVKADRASMSVGLELREPLLDHNLTAWCLTLPLKYRFSRRQRRSKVLPRQALARRVPRALFDRPKQGFTPPLAAWLNGPLRHAVRETLAGLASGDLAPLALPSACRDWAACAARLGDQHRQFLWRVMCFAAWLRHHRGIQVW